MEVPTPPLEPVQGDEPILRACVTIRAAGIGLAVPPPAEALLRFSANLRGWELHVRALDGKVDRLLMWAHAASIGTPHGSPISFEGPSIRLTVPTLHAGLAAVAQRARVEGVLLRPDGNAHAFVEGPRTAVQWIARELGPSAPGRETVRYLHPFARPELRPLLTLRQDWALKAAAEAGFYTVPRTQHLRTIAAGLHISSAALSELLRRAEANLVRSYIATEGARRPPGSDATPA